MTHVLQGQVVVLDEAHNIEDSARDAASGSWELDTVTAAMQDCERMAEAGALPAVHGGLAAFTSRLGVWMQKAAAEGEAAGGVKYSDFDSQSVVWNGTEGIAR